MTTRVILTIITFSLKKYVHFSSHLLLLLRFFLNSMLSLNTFNFKFGSVKTDFSIVVFRLLIVCPAPHFSSPDLIESMNRSPIHIPLPSKEKSDPMWKGFVIMPSVAKFATNAFRISGPCDNLLKLLPDTLQIYGRIKHEQVWDYLFQLKSTTHKVKDNLFFFINTYICLDLISFHLALL